MKNAFKTGLFALLISAGFAACKGNNSTHVPDSTRADDTTTVDSTIGNNGSAAGIDSGKDHSGSGGTDTIEPPSKKP